MGELTDVEKQRSELLTAKQAPEVAQEQTAPQRSGFSLVIHIPMEVRFQSTESSRNHLDRLPNLKVKGFH